MPARHRPDDGGCTFDAVLLDAAGTLIRTRRPVGETYAEFAGRYGAKVSGEQFKQAFVEVFGKMPGLAFEWHGRDMLQRLELDWWRTLVRLVVEQTGSSIGDFEAFFQALYSYYADGQAWACYPEVPRTLRALRDSGYRLAVVSNFDSRLPAILRALDIAELMDAVVYSSEAGSAKPDPAIFRCALDAVGVSAQRAIHVGDSVHADFEGARGAGVAGLLIRRGKRDDTKVHGATISSLERIFGYLRTDG